MHLRYELRRTFVHAHTRAHAHAHAHIRARAFSSDSRTKHILASYCTTVRSSCSPTRAHVCALVVSRSDSHSLQRATRYMHRLATSASASSRGPFSGPSSQARSRPLRRACGLTTAAEAWEKLCHSSLRSLSTEWFSRTTRPPRRRRLTSRRRRLPMLSRKQATTLTLSCPSISYHSALAHHSHAHLATMTRLASLFSVLLGVPHIRLTRTHSLTHSPSLLHFDPSLPHSLPVPPSLRSLTPSLTPRPTAIGTTRRAISNPHPAAPTPPKLLRQCKR